MQQKSQEIYLVVLNGQKCGPYTIGELQSLFVDGKIAPESLFTVLGSDNWQPLQAIYRQILDYEDKPDLGAGSQSAIAQHTAVEEPPSPTTHPGITPRGMGD